jgi:lysozyme
MRRGNTEGKGMDRMNWIRTAFSMALGAVILLPAAGAEERSAPTAQGLTVGVDLSKWQGAVDFAQIKAAGKTYVFVKVSQGGDDVDPDYPRNIAAARDAGLYVGSYHFYTTDHDAQSQFDNVVKHLDIKAGDLPLVVDIEVLSKNSLPDLAAELKVFLDLVEQKYGIKPIIYSGENFANEYLKGFADYPLWLAEYTGAPAPKLPLDWSAWTFWQHSENGSVPGVKGAVDLDRFNGTAEQIEALLVR